MEKAADLARTVKTYTAYRWVVNEVGRIHLSNVHFKAMDFEDAERICARWGWVDLGELVGEVDAGPALSAKCDAYVQCRNEEWLTTGRKRIVIE
jgi:hypothetical protein